MRVRELRKLAKLSQKELAEKIGISDAAISKYEQEGFYPSAEVLMKMADFFNVSVDTILGRNSKLLDLETLSKDQRKVVDAVVEKLSDNSVAKVVGYIENLED